MWTCCVEEGCVETYWGLFCCLEVFNIFVYDFLLQLILLLLVLYLGFLGLFQCLLLPWSLGLLLWTEDLEWTCPELV